VNSHDEVVKLTEAASEQEAAVICGYLESNGIRATYDKGNATAPPSLIAPVPGTLGALQGAFTGRQEILVRAADLAEAQRLLEAATGEP